jgi:hypothetical protein
MSTGASDEPDDVDEFKVYGSSSPTSNEVSTAIEGLDRTNPEKYLVKWTGSKNMDYDITYYVTEIGFGSGGAPNIKIESNQGGKYTIDSNPQGRPKVTRQSDGYTERLSQFKVYSLEFEWEHWIKKRLGLE